MNPIIINLVLSLIFVSYEKSDSDIIFDHKAHFGDRAIECQDCHKSAQSVSANDVNMPGHDECSDCHSVSNAPEDCKLCHTNAENPRGINMPKREVIFSHKGHLGENPTSKDCLTCHAGIDKAETHAATIQGYPSMTQCFQCHDGMSASADCETCHSQPLTMTQMVHPPDWMHAHQFAAVDEQRQSCAPCHHTESFCSDCHAGDNLVQTVHDLNYRFNHGLDAKGKESQCQSCHDIETFCGDCHNQEDVIPLSHFYASWNPRTDPTVHADFAQRDIESCASCHDEDSFTCGQSGCHGDTDGIRGTNVTIHPKSFMESEKGPWHDDPGYQCFQCHTNTQHAGAGFCGYCHGENGE